MYRHQQIREAFAIGCSGAFCACVLFASEPPSDVARRVARETVVAALESAVAGDAGLREAKLVDAISLDPDCELAHWHLAHVKVDNQWCAIEEAEAAWADDARQQAYVSKRASLTGDPAQDMSLARWCASQGLSDVAEYHYGQVLQNPASPGKLQEEARERLGLRWYEGRWLTEEQSEHASRQAIAGQMAVKKWTKPVQRWTKSLERGSRKQTEFVQQQMNEVRDPAIIPVLEQHMSAAGEVPASSVVAWLSQRPQIEATESLLRHALDAPWPTVRQTAILALAQRPVHDYVPQLLGQLMPPIESRFSIRVSRFGAVLHQHELFCSGQSENRMMRADLLETAWRGVTATPQIAVSTQQGLGSREPLSFDQQVQEISEIRQRTEWLALEASLRTAVIEQNVAEANRRVKQHNDRIYPVLEEATGAQVTQQPELWWDWWDAYNEQHAPPKGTRFWYACRAEYHGPSYSMTPALSSLSPRRECFVAGTPVRTDLGQVPIETLQPGQRVLSQDVDTGRLDYKVVTGTTQRPDAPLLEIVTNKTLIVATTGHPFWVNGKGWRMAKRLVVGDVLQTLAGPVSVEEINMAESATAFNLIVDDYSTYFVGDAGVLVHDNIPRQPTLAMTPGLLQE